jgi:GST-like protein
VIDLYTWTTPNGFKPLIALEELGIPYKLHWIDIGKGEQLAPAYLAKNPNNKIPTITDSDGPGGNPLTVFESGAILIYLADKTGKLMAPSGPDRYAAIQWTMFQMGGVGPMMGQLGHFVKFAKEKIPYAIDRYETEVKRLFHVLDGQLATQQFLAGTYSIADICTYPWVKNGPSLGIAAGTYTHVDRWLEDVGNRPAVQRAMASKPPAAS